MKQKQYKNYDKYKDDQIRYNKAKLRSVYANRDSIRVIVKFLQERNVDVKFGLCHGARNGWEVRELQKTLGDTITGTDISPTVGKFDNMVQWDFHDENPAWEGKAQMVYSNSLDHSYDPVKAVKSWVKSLSPDGFVFIEWSVFGHGADHVEKSDCFGCTVDELVTMLLDAGLKVEERLEFDDPKALKKHGVKTHRTTIVVGA